MRVPHAASILTEQVQAHNKRAKSTPIGDADGYGVQRTIQFDKTSSKWLAKVLPELDDPRIVGYVEDKDGIIVEFSSQTAADERHPFALSDAETVATSRPEGDDQS